MPIPSPRSLCLPLLAVATCAMHPTAAIAQESDPAGVRQTLEHMFDRPDGRPISGEQKERFAQFVKEHEGQDLGDFGYVDALLHYMERQPLEAASALDRFFASHDSIPIEEHSSIAGRIYLGALAEASRTGELDPERDGPRADRATRLYPDLRVLGTILGRLDDEGAQAIRLAAVRGALVSGKKDDNIDAMLRAMYGSSEEGGDGAARTARPADASAKVRDELTGRLAPELDVQHVVNGNESFSLESARGKVVVLDFFATWCGPCRAVVPSLVEMQEKYGDDVQVVAATRFYGYGSDFSAEDVKLPHGGTLVRDLDREGEIAINDSFAKAFDLNYPVVFTGEDVSKTYGIRGIPTVYVIGKDGSILGHVVGGGETNHARLVELVEQGLGASSKNDSKPAPDSQPAKEI